MATSITVPVVKLKNSIAGRAVNREQMAAFVSRTLDQSVKRGNPRAALGQWWTNKAPNFRVRTISGGHNPRFLAYDGLTVWVSNTQSNIVSRVDIRTGQRICTFTGITSPEQMVIFSGYVFVVSFQSPGKIFYARTTDTTDGVMTLYGDVGPNPAGITYDGLNLFTANTGTGPGTGSISRRNLVSGVATTFTTGFSQPVGLLYDGSHIWVTNFAADTLEKLDPNGSVLQTVAVGDGPEFLMFDGTNIWVPNFNASTITVVRVKDATGNSLASAFVLTTITGNGLDHPYSIATDGQRVLVTNRLGNSLSLWKATDLTPLGSFSLPTASFFNAPIGVCSDGVDFWVSTMGDSRGGTIAKF